MDNIFENDEQQLLSVPSNWTAGDLLGQTGVFFLKNVVKVLQLDSVKVKKMANALKAEEQQVWKTMGARKIWNHWIIRMEVFGPFYREHLVPPIRKIPKEWDGNVLLNQKGLFLLNEVCGLIPFSTNQLRHQARQHPNSQEVYGVWKDPELKTFVVDMERFAPWIRNLWGGDFGRQPGRQ